MAWTWTYVPVTSPASYDGCGMAFVGGNWVSMSFNDGYAVYATDPLGTWTAVATAAARWSGRMANDGTTAQAISTIGGRAATTADGTAFTNNAGAPSLRASAFGNGVYVGVGSASTNAAVTADGSTSWAFYSTGSTAGGTYFDIAFSPSLGRFCAPNYANAGVAVCDDAGVTWTFYAAALPFANPSQIVWSETLGLFVCMSENGQIATSPTGTNDWTDCGFLDAGREDGNWWNLVELAGGVIVAMHDTDGAFAYSDDGFATSTVDTTGDTSGNYYYGAASDGTDTVVIASYNAVLVGTYGGGGGGGVPAAPEAITFTALAPGDTPETVGDASVALPTLQVRARQVASNDALVELAGLQVIASGFDRAMGHAVVLLPPLGVVAFKAPGNHAIVHLPALGLAADDVPVLTSDPTAASVVLPGLEVVATGFSVEWGNALVVLPALGAQGMQTAGAYAIARLPKLQAIGSAAIDAPNRAMLVQPAGYIAGLVSPVGLAHMGDTLTVGLTQTATETLVLRVAVALRDVPTTHAQSLAQLRDALALEDRLALVYHLQLQVAVALGATAELTGIHVMRMADLLVLGGHVGGYREAYALITEALAFGALLDGAKVATFADGLTLEAAIAVAHQAAMQLVDGLLLGAELTADVQLSMLLADTLALGVTQLTAAEALMQLTASLGFAVQLSLDGEDFIAWSMLTDTKALSRYDHYPFNSFMRIGGKPYGIAATGRYLLEGPNDAGTPIAARLRLAMTALGARVLKRLPAIYYATAGGDLFFKVIAASDADGAREAHVYRAYVRNGQSVREGRVEPGRGLKAVFFGLELENVDGGGFDVDALQFHPLYLERRIRGNAGGKP